MGLGYSKMVNALAFDVKIIGSIPITLATSMTKIQLLNRKRKRRVSKNCRRILNGCPQKKGTCLRVFILKPKKPNSASRKVIKVVLFSNRLRTHASIPGKGHGLQRYSTVLIRGGRVRDLPGMKYKVVRNVFDLKRVYDRIKARSKYGISKKLV